jgi:hypothetical protein
MYTRPVNIMMHVCLCKQSTLTQLSYSICYFVACWMHVNACLFTESCRRYVALQRGLWAT